MRYGSVCSGIEGLSVAVERAGLSWRPSWFCEIDSFCRELLAARYQGVPNHGDITAAQIESFAAVDVVCGGTPCQSFSVQGKRGGLDDGRGRLALRFGEIVSALRPEWVVWENVPGSLTSGGGRDFDCITADLVERGYSLAWRVLDAQFFGVPQRRRRLFLVGHRGTRWEIPAAVLFEPRTSGELDSTAEQIQARRRAACESAGAIGWSGDETPKHGLEITPTLRASQGGEGVGYVRCGEAVRLTADDWELLQGFPEGYTAIDGASDAQRRKALGNSFAVPVVAWIIERIDIMQGALRATERNR